MGAYCQSLPWHWLFIMPCSPCHTKYGLLSMNHSIKKTAAYNSLYFSNTNTVENNWSERARLFVSLVLVLGLHRQHYISYNKPPLAQRALKPFEIKPGIECK